MLRKYRFTTGLAVAIALCAAAPAAAISLDAIDAGDKGLPKVTQDKRSPDAIDARDKGLPTVTQDMRSPDAGTPFDATTDGAATARLRIVDVPPSGFEWGDAGIGAAGMLAIVLLAVGAGVTGSHRRRRRRVTATAR
jgi:hypothetical protein